MTNQLKSAFEKQLLIVVQTNSIEKIECFLINSAFIKFNTEYKQSVMDYFLYSNYYNEKIVKWALTTKNIGLIANIHVDFDRILRLACSHNEHFAKYLLTSSQLIERANINAIHDRSSALINAIKNDNLDFVQYLTTSSELNIKARLDIGKNCYEDPLCIACDFNLTAIVKHLLCDLCYPDKTIFNASTNLHRFEHYALCRIIMHDNIELFTFIVDQNLWDINKNLQQFFCQSVIYDSVNIAHYLYDIFPTKPDLFNLKFENKSLFFKTAQHNSLTRMLHHFFLHNMLQQYSHLFNAEDLQELKQFYIYDDNNVAQPLSSIIDIYKQKYTLESNLKLKNTKEKTVKI